MMPVDIDNGNESDVYRLTVGDTRGMEVGIDNESDVYRISYSGGYPGDASR